VKHFEIKRIACDGINPTMGVLLLAGRTFALTLERPWLNNRRGESCIPIGEYICYRCSSSPDYGFKDSPKFGDTFQVFDVADRSKILFHKGNINDDTHGCILVGEQFGTLGGKDAILASAHGYGEFMSLLRHDTEFMLSITEHF
jgi:hypothetical protein